MSLHALQGFEYLEPEIMQQLTDGWLRNPCRELFAHIQQAYFLVISTSTPTEHLLQLCEERDITLGELLGQMQQVEFSFLGENQRQPGRQFVLIRHKHVDPSVVNYCLEQYMPCLPARGVQHTYETPPQARAAHLQQLKAPPADTDITAGHSKLRSSATAGTVAKAHLLSAPASSAELVQGRQQQQQESESARIAEVNAATASLGQLPASSPPADTTTAQTDTLTNRPVPAPLPQVGKVKTHSSVVDPRSAVSTADAKSANIKVVEAKAADAKVVEAKAADTVGIDG